MRIFLTSQRKLGTPQTLAPGPQTLAPGPQTLAPGPQTLAPAPQTLAPSPQTLAPAPHALAPAPQTLASAPCRCLWPLHQRAGPLGCCVWMPACQTVSTWAPCTLTYAAGVVAPYYSSRLPKDTVYLDLCSRCGWECVPVWVGVSACVGGSVCLCGWECVPVWVGVCACVGGSVCLCVREGGRPADVCVCSRRGGLCTCAHGTLSSH